MSNILQAIENEQLRTDIPKFSQGDTVVVRVRVKEGEKERLQAFEGVVIAKRNRGLHSGVFQTHSPLVGSVEVKRRGLVRQAKLYYLRELTGKAARIKEKLGK